MKKLGRFILTAAKWGGGLLLVYVASLFFNDLSFETRIGWFIFGLAMAIAYVDGSLKDRISMLEARINELNSRINGRY